MFMFTFVLLHCPFFWAVCMSTSVYIHGEQQKPKSHSLYVYTYLANKADSDSDSDWETDEHIIGSDILSRCVYSKTNLGLHQLYPLKAEIQYTQTVLKCSTLHSSMDPFKHQHVNFIIVTTLAC